MKDREFERQIKFLRSRGAAEETHSFSTLLQHLMGTRELLLSWHASPELCAAGLFHSVYGTETFPVSTINISERDSVRDVIGIESEQIVYFHSIMTKESFDENLLLESGYKLRDRTSTRSFSIGRKMFRDLCNLNAANWLEQYDRLPRSFRYVGMERSRLMLKFVLPKAATTLRAVHSFLA